jgi:CHASE3 domain sensor protein
VNEKSTGIAIPIWGRISLRRLAVWVSLALVILAGLISLVLIQGISRQLVDITQTYAVRQQASELIITLGEAEASQRGYLLTRDPGYLDPYNAAIGSIEAQVDALRYDRRRSRPKSTGAGDHRRYRG